MNSKISAVLAVLKTVLNTAFSAAKKYGPVAGELAYKYTAKLARFSFRVAYHAAVGAASILVGVILAEVAIVILDTVLPSRSESEDSEDPTVGLYVEGDDGSEVPDWTDYQNATEEQPADD